jgi:phospholipase C
MARPSRRTFLIASTAAAALPAAIARAAEIPAHSRTGSIKDVEHVVIFMQENRSFDHYFGTMNGVRGFADRFPIPVHDEKLGVRPVWLQGADDKGERVIAPYHLNTAEHFELMRVKGTPHTWPDAQAAWDDGRMGHWPMAKTERSMGYFTRADAPFQWALADAFTICDAYHCSIQTGTNSNRLFLWTGTNDPSGAQGGPAIGNSHDNFADKGGDPEAYRWTVYVERLQAAGISWRVYEDMADNFTDNPMAGFAKFRASHAGEPGSDPSLAREGLSTFLLDRLRADVIADRLPQVSYIVAPAADSEHPRTSSPAQGADYTARVLDALTANPDVWSKTALFLMFDENDGFFDHVPPPAPPSGVGESTWGVTTVSTKGEHHLVKSKGDTKDERDEFMGRAYGLGPRVPMYVISPWSRGGWVNSQVFDHTSVIRFMETRFGVMEPNISRWRREVCGDLTSCFDFRTPNAAPPYPHGLPATAETAARARAISTQPDAKASESAAAFGQEDGVRPSRALPYYVTVRENIVNGDLQLTFDNTGAQGAVFHLYDLNRLEIPSRRLTVGVRGVAMIAVRGSKDGGYDLAVFGPNGFYRRLHGNLGKEPRLDVIQTVEGSSLCLAITNRGAKPVHVVISPEAYAEAVKAWKADIAPGVTQKASWSLDKSGGWYDLAMSLDGGSYHRRWAGRVETGRDSISDPAMHGPARMTV